jgi:hypothetical protein
VAFVKTHFERNERAYTELYGHFALKNFGVAGDAIVAFVGPCDVGTDNLVDLADQRAGARIVAARMLHFVVEHFGLALAEAVWRQRLLAAIVLEEVRQRAPQAPLRREGDDVYAGGGKLTVSIATLSPTSAIIHFGVNVDGAGAPIEVSDLGRLGVNAEELATVVMSRYADEVDRFVEALGKVRGIC